MQGKLSTGLHRLVRGGARAAFLLACGLVATAGVHAASLQVAPVSVAFAPGEQARILYLDNHDGDPIEVQVRLMRWSQQDGVDRLDPTQDVVATPAIVRIGPGERQTVRLVRRQSDRPDRELSYRALVNELPDNQARSGQTGLRVLLAYSIPVFIAATEPPPAPAPSGTDAPPPQVDLSGVRARLSPGSGGTVLAVSNQGPRHVRIGGLVLESADGTSRPVTEGLLGYVLPGQQASFRVDLAPTLPAGQTLKARFNDERDARPVPLDSAGP